MRPYPARHMLAALALAVIMLLSGSRGVQADAAAVTPCGPDCSSVFVEPLFRQCLLSITPNATGVVFPEDEAYDAARRVFNYRTLSFPTAVFYASTAAEVAAAVKCAHAWGVRVTPAAGRQGFQGAAVRTGYLVVDVTSLTQTSLSADKRTFAVGAGNSNAMTLSALHATNITGAAVTTGVCSFVGSAGFNLGGGFGPLGRYLGLGCDNVVGLEVVLADGSIVKADAENNPDLLWASCGGGGGTFGIVTAFKYNIRVLPNEGRVSAVQINYAPGVNTTVAAFKAFQAALPTLDNRMGFTLDLSNAQFALSGVFLGTPDEALQVLQGAKMLDNLDPEAAVTPEVSDVADAVPSGLVIKAFPSYFDFAAQIVVPTWAPAGTPWGPASNFTPTPDNLAFMYKLMSGQDGLRVVGGPDYNVWHYSQSRLSGLLPDAGIEAVVQFSLERSTACAESNYTSSDCLLSIGGHVLGGAYADKAPDAAAFPHRDKYFVLDAVVSVPSDLADAVSSSPEGVPMLGVPANITNQFLTALKPFLEAPEAAYANYQTPALEDFEQAYFGGNAARLRAIKAKYDPLGVFDKPYTVRGVPAEAAAAPSGSPPSVGTGPAAVPAPGTSAASSGGPRAAAWLTAGLALVAAAALV